MPLTNKGKKIMTAMKEEYGKKKGEQVFYASKNNGNIYGVEKYSKGDAVDTGDLGSEAANDQSLSSGNKGSGYGGPDGDPRTGGGVKTQNNTVQVNPGPRKVPTIGPFSFGVNQVLKGSWQNKNLKTARKDDLLGGEMLTTGPKNTGPKIGGGGGNNNSSINPITPIKPVDPNLVLPKDNFFNFKAYKVGGLSGGVRYGPPPKRGPNPNVPPIKMKHGSKKEIKAGYHKMPDGSIMKNSDHKGSK